MPLTWSSNLMARVLCWSESVKTVKTESQECVETSTMTLRMTKSCPMAHLHKMTMTLDTAGRHPQANRGELSWKAVWIILWILQQTVMAAWYIFSRCGSTDEEIGDRLNECLFTEEYSDLCSVITNTSGPFSACHLHADPQPFFTSCVYDLCLYTPANGMLCSAVAAYERRCSVLGLTIPEWRSDLQCGMFALG